MMSSPVSKIKTVLSSTTNVSKNDALYQFIDMCKHLPSQGSDEWKKSRLSYIGGSEVATLLKMNKYNTVSKLIQSKLGYDQFNGSIVTYWGNVFEELIRQYAERKFKCTIQETGSIKHTDGYLSYSPDGLAVIDSTHLVSEFGSINTAFGMTDTHEDYLTLFEFKCPHSRIPSSEIPDHYLPQVKTGMNVIGFLELGVFMQAVYRRCSVADLRYNKAYNKYGHFKDAEPRGNPISYGFIAMYATTKEQYDNCMNMISCVGCPSIYGTHDLGRLNETDALEELLGSCVDKTVKMDYTFKDDYDQSVFERHDHDLKMYDVSMQRQSKMAVYRMRDQYEYLIGVMPYKMIDVFITPVPKTHSYLEDHAIVPKAKKVIEFIQSNSDTGLTDLKSKLRRFRL